MTETKSKIKQVETQIEEVKYVISENMNSALSRGIQLEDIDKKSLELQVHAEFFKSKSQSVRRKTCLANAKFWILGLIVCAVILYTILVLSCGGIILPDCH